MIAAANAGATAAAVHSSASQRPTTGDQDGTKPHAASAAGAAPAAAAAAHSPIIRSPVAGAHRTKNGMIGGRPHNPFPNTGAHGTIFDGKATLKRRDLKKQAPQRPKGGPPPTRDGNRCSHQMNGVTQKVDPPFRLMHSASAASVFSVVGTFRVYHKNANGIVLTGLRSYFVLQLAAES